MVYEQTFPKTAINGIAKWITPDKAFIQVSDRNKRVDTFWFSFMHELGHILKGKKKGIFIDLKEGGCREEDQEKIANEFAEKELIQDCEGYAKLKTDYRERNISNFAKKIGIDKGIIAGMLQHDLDLYANKMLADLRHEIDFAEMGIE